MSCNVRAHAHLHMWQLYSSITKKWHSSVHDMHKYVPYLRLHAQLSFFFLHAGIISFYNMSVSQHADNLTPIDVYINDSCLRPRDYSAKKKHNPTN